MTLAEKLRSEGYGKPEFTKSDLMLALTEKFKHSSSVHYTMGRHVSTNLNMWTIGTCNPNNRQYLVKWLNEEGFNFEFGFNGFGVEHIKIYL